LPKNTVSPRHQEHAIRRYLLGDPSLSEEEKAAIEESYLRDGRAHEDLLEVEDELVDRYVFGQLDADETVLFEDSLKDSPRWKDKVELATALREYATRPSADLGRNTVGGPAFLGVPSAYRFAAACGVAVLVVAVATYFLRTNHLERPLPTTATTKGPNYETPPKHVPAPVEAQEHSLPKPSTSSVLSFILIPDLVRGNGEQTQVRLSAGRYTVQLRMERDDEPYGRYEATVSTPEGRTIAHQVNLRPRSLGKSRTVALALSSEILRSGVYILNLKGQTTTGQPDDLDDYTFEVSNRKREK